MKCCNSDSKTFFLCGAKLFFGLWLLYVGLAKWIFMGPTAFVGWITETFNATWSPPALNTGLAWIILFAEPLLALWIFSGKHARQAWMAAAFFMFLLTFGQTILMKYDVVANNWMYLIFCLTCAALSDTSCCNSASSCCGEKKGECGK